MRGKYRAAIEGLARLTPPPSPSRTRGPTQSTTADGLRGHDGQTATSQTATIFRFPTPGSTRSALSDTVVYVRDVTVLT